MTAVLCFDDEVVRHLTWELDLREPTGPQDDGAHRARPGGRPLASAWAELPTSTRAVCLTLPPAGAALSIVGLAGDLRGWWDGLGFAANLLSSLTGLLFAVPFALVVVGRLAEHQDDVAERRRVARMSRREWDLIEAAWGEAARLAPHMLDLCRARALPAGSGLTQAVRFTHLTREVNAELRHVSGLCGQLPTRWDSAEAGLNQRRIEVGLNPLPASCAAFLRRAADEFAALYAACREEPSLASLDRAGTSFQALESMGLSGDTSGLEPLQQTLLFDVEPRPLGASPDPSAGSYESISRRLRRSPRPLPRVSLRSDVRPRQGSRPDPT
ncbi:hypothetical protein ACO229_03965 [Promicromonospora sp. MS192]|uniref:hypothetical protein n=1 Tax=Promicromonospora sp. MS192 TaxID=3412684 RepID=UPI003C2D94C2